MALLGTTLRRLRTRLASWTDASRLNRVEKRTLLDGCERPVLLLHGFFSTRRTFRVLERRLRLDGYGVFSLNLGGFRRSYNTRGIDDLADLVRAKVERIYARHPGMGPLTIVGHSKGGLIATYYVKKLGGWRRTSQVVTLGTPHRGTPVAWLGLPVALIAPSVVQLLPGSGFLERLDAGPWPHQVRLVSLWSRRDQLAPGTTALVDPYRIPGARNVEVDCLHFEFLTRKRIYLTLRRELEAARPARAPAGVVPPLAG